MKFIIKLLVILLSLYSSAASAPYKIERSVVASGGNIQKGPFLLRNTAGQTLIGKSVEANNVIYSGYWFPIQLGGCDYVVGDVNGNGQANGIDVTYGVSYLKGGSAPPDSCDCLPITFPFYGAMDVNGSCSANGIDITFYVSYLKGIQPALLFCADCPPAGQIAPPDPAVMPISAPMLKPTARLDTNR